MRVAMGILLPSGHWLAWFVIDSLVFLYEEGG